MLLAAKACTNCATGPSCGSSRGGHQNCARAISYASFHQGASHTHKCSENVSRNLVRSRFSRCTPAAIVAPPSRPRPLFQILWALPMRLVCKAHSLKENYHRDFYLPRMTCTGLFSWFVQATFLTKAFVSGVVHLTHRGGVVCHFCLFGHDAQARVVGSLRLLSTVHVLRMQFEWLSSFCMLHI